jgi:TolA-binding protein
MKKSVAIFCSLIILSGCSQNYQAEREFWKAEKTLSGVTRAMVQDQGPQVFDPMIAAFKKIYEQYPSTPKAVESLFVISNLYIRQKKYDEAIQSLEKIIQNYSDSRDQAPEARYGIAGIYEITGEWEKAETLFWETAEYHPYHPKGLYAPVHIVLHYKKVKDKDGMALAYQKATEFYQKMLKQTGPIQAASALKNYLALTQLANGSWREARATWDALPKEFPDSQFAPLALLASGELSWKKQESQAATASYEEFLNKYPKHQMVPRSMVQLGMIHAEQKNFVKAREWFEKAIAQEKNQQTVSDVKLLIGKAFQDEGQWAEAEKVYQDIETNYKNTNAALQIPFMLASYHEEKGNNDEAQKILDEAIGRYQSLMDSADPRMADMAMRLQNAAYAEKGDWKKVIGNFEEKIKQEKSPARKANWLFLKAIVVENRIQDAPAALELYTQFVTDYPNHPLTSVAKSRQDFLLKKA